MSDLIAKMQNPSLLTNTFWFPAEPKAGLDFFSDYPDDALRLGILMTKVIRVSKNALIADEKEIAAMKIKGFFNPDFCPTLFPKPQTLRNDSPNGP